MSFQYCFFSWAPLCYFYISNYSNYIINVTQAARNLGVIFDASLHFDKQLNNVVMSYFFRLNIISFFPFADLQKVIRAFIYFQLDYCNNCTLFRSQLELPSPSTAGPKCCCSFHCRDKIVWAHQLHNYYSITVSITHNTFTLFFLFQGFLTRSVKRHI